MYNGYTTLVFAYSVAFSADLFRNLDILVNHETSPLSAQAINSTGDFPVKRTDPTRHPPTIPSLSQNDVVAFPSAPFDPEMNRLIPLKRANHTHPR